MLYHSRLPSSAAVKIFVARTSLFASSHDAGSRSKPPRTKRAGSMISMGEYHSAVALDVVASVNAVIGINFREGLGLSWFVLAVVWIQSGEAGVYVAHELGL